MTCHGPGYAPQKEWAFATKTSAEIGDLWDWRAAGSDPYKYAVDDYLTVTGYWGTYARSKKTGRRGLCRLDTFQPFFYYSYRVNQSLSNNDVLLRL